MILREGQQVRVKDYEEGKFPKHFIHGMEKFCGEIVTIEKIGRYSDMVILKEDPLNFLFHKDDFEIYHSFKSLLQTGRIVENGYGVRRLVVGDIMVGTSDCAESSYYDDSLEHITGDKDLNIVAVYVNNVIGSLDYILSFPGDCIWRRGEDT